ncbi:HD domain-containing protein [Dorea acetigenes]|uniref:HD domain-containing protein n=1 Tax=Dorea acetigenes TaxID=2981787 RepID=A0ABT2RJV7_9FIRM|nr:HD domain-containing protein [Dorea acetigenes]MCU6685689.1 HD domain-containing protein [Dorea acetigenes]SCI59626.1 Predicted HD-superfamily hydrolase [uncultured Clostridium sp.]
MDRQANINRFEAEMAKVKREGADRLMAFIRKSDMYAAPASTRFHLSVTGGLLQHSLNVLDALRGSLTKNEDGTYSYDVAGVPVARVTEENIIIMALLHDICKTYFYTTETRNRKVNGKWEQYEAFTVDDKIPYGHGEKSVMMIEEYMKLQPIERYAIRWHMGYTENDTLSLNNAIDRYPMIWALHSADTQASHYMEAVEGNKLAYADQSAGEYADQPTTEDTAEPLFEEATPV